MLFITPVSCNIQRTDIGANVTRSLLRVADDRHRDAPDADRTILIVDDAPRPDLAGPPGSFACGGAEHIAVHRRAHMVGVDFHPYADVLCRVQRPRRADRRHRFAQHHRCAAVQPAEGLVDFAVHRHLRRQPVIAVAGEFDPEQAGQHLRARCGHGRKIGLCEPDGHAGVIGIEIRS